MFMLQNRPSDAVRVPKLESSQVVPTNYAVKLKPQLTATDDGTDLEITVADVIPVRVKS